MIDSEETRRRTAATKRNDANHQPRQQLNESSSYTAGAWH